VTEIARGSNISYNSLKVFFNQFVNSGIVVKTRKIGKSDYYKLNMENSFIKNLIKLDWSLTKISSGIEEKKTLTSTYKT